MRNFLKGVLLGLVITFLTGIGIAVILIGGGTGTSTTASAAPAEASPVNADAVTLGAIGELMSELAVLIVILCVGAVLFAIWLGGSAPAAASSRPLDIPAVLLVGGLTAASIVGNRNVFTNQRWTK